MNNQTAIQPTPEQIARCAYFIWEKEGCPNGKDEIHWLQAEKQIKQERTQGAGRLLLPEPAAPTAAPVSKPLPSKRRKVMAG